MAWFSVQLRVKNMIVLFLVLWLFGFSACANAPLPVAQFRFTDVDTMKPIQGAWVSFLWFGPADSLGRSKCMRAVLGNSGVDGWFRDTARESNWHLGGPPTAYFVQGYESFKFIRPTDEPQHILGIIPMTLDDAAHWPIWTARLRAQGYEWDQRFENSWKRSFSSAEFSGQLPDPEHLYFVSARSPPNLYSAHFGPINYQCDEAVHAESIGTKNFPLARRQMAVEALRVICDEAWATVPNGSFSNTANWIQLALLPPHTPELQHQVAELLPEYSSKNNWWDALGTQRPLTTTEQKLFCSFAKSRLATSEVQ
jgi:hypothetical protein